MSESSRKTEYYFFDMLEAIDDIFEFSWELAYEEFASDRKTIYAVIRCLEIIGEAAKNVPVYIKEKYSSIPWKEIAGMRDKLIHGYFGVDIKLVWDTINEDLPQLKDELLKIKAVEFSG